MAKLATWLVVLGLITLCSTGFAYNVWKQGRCPGHWHSSFSVYVDGERVSFRHAQYQFESAGVVPGNQMPLSSHIHNSDDYEWHFEPNPSRCLRFSDAIQHVGMELSERQLVLKGAHEQMPLGSGEDGRVQGGTYTVEGNKTLATYHQVDGRAWEQIDIDDLRGRQPRDGEKILILYGDYDSEDVSRFQSEAPDPPTYVTQLQREGRQPNYLAS